MVPTKPLWTLTMMSQYQPHRLYRYEHSFVDRQGDIFDHTMLFFTGFGNRDDAFWGVKSPVVDNYAFYLSVLILATHDRGTSSSQYTRNHSRFLDFDDKKLCCYYGNWHVTGQ